MPEEDLEAVPEQLPPFLFSGNHWNYYPSQDENDVHDVHLSLSDLTGVEGDKYSDNDIDNDNDNDDDSDNIPDICHERHEYIRVNVFWSV